jgi:membrane fusion protein
VIAARPLFRNEALEAQRQQWLGSVRLTRPLSLTWITVGVVCALGAVLCFLSLAHYTRKATAVGILAPDKGLIRVVSASVGSVVERRVTEGQSVEAGDVMFVVALDRALLSAPAQSRVRQSLDERRRSLTEAAGTQRRLAQTRSVALERRLAAVDGELSQLDGERELQRQRLVLSEQSMSRLQALQAEQFISAAQVQVKSEELFALLAAAQALSRQRAALLRDREELEGERRALPLTTGHTVGALERDLAQAERDAAEQEGEQRLVVRAPHAGTVSTLLAEAGQSVSPASALATILPSGARLQAQLYAPSSAVGFVQPGQTVRLRYEAFPYQKFGHQPGQVLQVSRTPLAPSELAALALPALAAGAAGGEPLFRITVALEGAPSAIPLAPGMRLQADLLLERRRLIEWLFEPILGLRGRL